MKALKYFCIQSHLSQKTCCWKKTTKNQKQTTKNPGTFIPTECISQKFYPESEIFHLRKNLVLVFSLISHWLQNSIKRYLLLLLYQDFSPQDFSFAVLHYISKKLQKEHQCSRKSNKVIPHILQNAVQRKGYIFLLFIFN